RVQHVLPREDRGGGAERQDAKGSGLGRDARRPPIVECVSGLVGNLGQAARLIAALLMLTAAAPGAAAGVTLTVPHDRVLHALVGSRRGRRARNDVLRTDA